MVMMEIFDEKVTKNMQISWLWTKTLPIVGAITCVTDLNVPRIIQWEHIYPPFIQRL